MRRERFRAPVFIAISSPCSAFTGIPDYPMSDSPGLNASIRRAMRRWIHLAGRRIFERSALRYTRPFSFYATVRLYARGPIYARVFHLRILFPIRVRFPPYAHVRLLRARPFRVRSPFTRCFPL